MGGEGALEVLQEKKNHHELISRRLGGEATSKTSPQNFKNLVPAAQ